MLSDSWAWCWFPTKNTVFKGDCFFSSSRYSYLEPQRNYICFPILKILLESQSHDVTVLGRPGDSNSGQIELLEEHLPYVSNQYDLIIFLQTDPLRDLTKLCDMSNTDDDKSPDYYTIERTGLKHYSVDQFNNTVDELLENTYTYLFNVVKRQDVPDIPILVLGGCGTVRSDIVKKCANNIEFTNAHVVSENLLADIDHLTTGEPRVDFHPCCLNRIEQHIDHTWNPELVDYLYDISFITFNEKNPHRMDYYTYPDTMHPNASSMIFAVEMINKYLDKLDI